MKKHKQAKGTSFVRRFPRLLGAGILLTLAFLTIGVVAGISKQRSRAQESNKQEGSIPVANAAKAHLTSGQKVDQTAQIRPLTQEEAQRLAVALKELANQSTDGLQAVQHADGTVSMDLQGHFQNVALAKRNEDGTVSQSCIDNPEAGAAFFGIDPQLVGVKTKTGAAPSSTTATHK
jgi:hypothetical protein